ncbi:protein ripply3 [Rhynchocyon petersi]
MGPEAAAGAQEARGQGCHCPGDGSRRSLPPGGPESWTPWRPWSCASGNELMRTTRQLEPGINQQTFGSKGAFGFQHPVRLYLPISKSQEYLQSSGEQVLASFPVQATIHFYNDESDSDDDEDGEEEIQSSALQCQRTESSIGNGLGAECRDHLVNQDGGYQGSSSFCGKGPFPHCAPAGTVKHSMPK